MGIQHRAGSVKINTNNLQITIKVKIFLLIRGFTVDLQHIAQAALKITILLAQSSECRDYRCVPL